MRRFFITSVALLLAWSVQAQNWPSFRGPQASGVADGTNPPVTWDAEKSVNLRWKTPIPGLGHSSPVIFGNRIFITTAISNAAGSEFVHGHTETAASAQDNSQHQWRVYCLDRESGRILWERTIIEGVPKARRHLKASHANPTPATDGKYLIVSFGSEGLYCLDMAGKLRWKHDLGLLDGGWTPAPNTHWGFGSSPIIYKHLAIVQCDTQNQQFIAAFNLADGKRIWQMPRAEDSSWSTPTIYSGNGRAELLTSGTKYFRGYDPLTGQELWRLAGGSDVKIPTPIASNDLYFIGGGSAHEKLKFYAVRAGAKGEIKTADDTSAAHIAWQSETIRPHVVTPLVYRNQLYVCSDAGIVTQFDALTGKPGWRGRLGRGAAFSASPVAADGRIYFASEDGEVFVLKAGAEFEIVACNPVGEVILATPALAQNMIIVRGQHHIFAFQAENIQH